MSGWKNSMVVKSIYFTSRGPKFSFQQLRQVAPAQNLSGYLHSCVHRLTHNSSIKT